MVTTKMIEPTWAQGYFASLTDHLLLKVVCFGSVVFKAALWQAKNLFA